MVDRLSLTSAFAATRGRFWSLVLLTLTVMLPLIGAEWDDPADAVAARLRGAVAERAPDLDPWLPLLAATLGVELPDLDTQLRRLERSLTCMT